jgi:hypothetical protein
MVTFSKLFLMLSCAMAVTSCGGSQSSPAPQPPNPPTSSAADGLVGTPDQPFAQRVAQTPYPTSSLLKDPEAMKRILGPDLDQNGIRDDVDALIDTLTTDPIERKAYQQYARVLQRGFLVSNKQEAVQFGDGLAQAAACFVELMKQKTTTQENLLTAMTAVHMNKRTLAKQNSNTFERVIRMDEVNTLAHGYVLDTTPTSQNSCE